ncbi:MAG TPA: hypothetical protein VGL83_16750 [Stellaceae bacterium]
MRIADRNFQEKAWFNPGPGGPVSSPTEMLSTMLDTYRFEKASQASYLDLSDAQRASCLRFGKMLETFARGPKAELSDKETIDDPEWDKIRKAAADLLKILPT